MAGIETYLEQIKNAIYGKDVRQAIHDGIEQCYYDGKAGAVDLEARQRIDEFTHLEEGSTTGDAELIDGRTVGNVTYTNIGGAIRAVNDKNIPYFHQYLDVSVGNEAFINTDEYSLATGKILLRDGTVSDNSAYNILTINLDENYTYYLRGRVGNNYNTIRFMQIEDVDGNVIAIDIEGSSDFAEKYISGVSGVCKLCYRNANTYTAKKYEANVGEIKNKAEIIVGDKIEYEATVTGGAFISATSGRITTTSQPYSYTSPIPVKAGNIIRFPSANDSHAIALIAKEVPNPTPLFASLLTSDDTNRQEYYYVVEEDCNVAFSTRTAVISQIEIYESPFADLYEKIGEVSTGGANFSNVPSKGQILYEGDDRVSSGYICNAVMYDDGVIIAARSNGKVVRIGYDGTEEVVLSLEGSNMDWRCLYIDSNENVYASPHASWGSMQMSDRGLYRLTKGGSTMTKVISLYNPSSSIPSETEENNDTIWTMCEDASGNLYAGVYAHTVRNNPAIYKSTDGGLTWSYIFNFNTAGLTTNGRHIHTIIYSEWQKALYCIVGEVNTVFKSTNGGTSWTDLHVELTVKGSSMCPTPHGIFIGSDGSYNCDIDILYPDDATHKKVFRGWANTVFAIRRSDLTGFLYAFTKIDSSVNTITVFPPVTVLEGTTTIEQWRETVTEAQYNAWLAYHDSVASEYPSDAIRPQHFGILVSRDGGANWTPLKRFACPSTAANGLWTTGYFKNGECLTGRMERSAGGTVIIKNPIVISEGKHKYVSSGCNLDGEILVRTNSSNIVSVI